MKLLIDTRDSGNISAKIEKDGEIFEEISVGDVRRPESILLVIERVCKKGRVGIHDIDEISVEEGPGSYTGLKVGVSVANALSFSLKKTVNGRPFGELIEPKYE